jgi:HTH-type transcriptional regulator, competence development regulator
VSFGSHVRQLREAKGESLRSFAQRVEVSPAYISQIENDLKVPTEEFIGELAEALDEDFDVLLALTGRVSPELREVICKRPKLFAEIIRQLKNAPDQSLRKIAREVRDGEW